MNRATSLLLFMLFLAVKTIAQTGTITGTVINENREYVLGAVIEVWQGDKLKGRVLSDTDGEYNIKVLAKGKYTVKISDTTCTYIVEKVPVKKDRFVECHSILYNITKKHTVVVIRYVQPVILCQLTGPLSKFTVAEMRKDNRRIKKGLWKIAKAQRKSYSYNY